MHCGQLIRRPAVAGDCSTDRLDARMAPCGPRLSTMRASSPPDGLSRAPAMACAWRITVCATPMAGLLGDRGAQAARRRPWRDQVDAHRRRKPSGAESARRMLRPSSPRRELAATADLAWKPAAPGHSPRPCGCTSATGSFPAARSASYQAHAVHALLHARALTGQPPCIARAPLATGAPTHRGRAVSCSRRPLSHGAIFRFGALGAWRIPAACRPA